MDSPADRIREYLDPREDILRAHCEQCVEQFASIWVLGDATDRIPRASHIRRAMATQTSAVAGASQLGFGHPAITPEASLLATLTERSSRILISGDGGVGKSETTRMLAYELAARMESSAFDDALLRVPILVSLNDFSIERPTRTEATYGPLLDAILQRTPAFIEAGEEGRRLFNDLGGSGQLVFLFDGIDEMPNEVLKPFAEMVSSAFTTGSVSKCSMMVASRPVQVPQRFLNLFSKDHRFELQPLTDADIKTYITAFFAVSGRSIARGERLARLIDHADFSLRQIIHQPLFLALCCELGNSEDFALPPAQTELMRLSIVKLFSRRGIEHPEAVMRILPWLFQGSGRSDYAMMTHFIEAIGEAQRHDTLIANCYPKEQYSGASILHIAVMKTGLFVERTSGRYVCINRSIHDFLMGAWFALLAAENAPRIPFNSGNQYSKLLEMQAGPTLTMLGIWAWNERAGHSLYWMAATLWRGDNRQRETIVAGITWLLNHLQCPHSKLIDHVVIPASSIRHMDRPTGKKSRQTAGGDLVNLDDTGGTLLHRIHDVLCSAGDEELAGHEDLIQRFCDCCTMGVYREGESVDVFRIVRLTPLIPRRIQEIILERLDRGATGDPRQWVKEFLATRRLFLLRIFSGTSCYVHHDEAPVQFFELIRDHDGTASFLEELQQHGIKLDAPPPAESLIEGYYRWHRIDQLVYYAQVGALADESFRKVTGLFGGDEESPLIGKLVFRGWYDDLAVRFKHVTGEIPIVLLKEPADQAGQHKFWKQRQSGIEGNRPGLMVVDPWKLCLYDFLLPGGMMIDSDESDIPNETVATGERSEGNKKSHPYPARKESLACAYLLAHPTASKAEIAKNVDCSPTVMSTPGRWKEFKKLWDAMQQRVSKNLPDGVKRADGSIDAHSDDE